MKKMKKRKKNEPTLKKGFEILENILVERNSIGSFLGIENLVSKFAIYYLI